MQGRPGPCSPSTPHTLFLWGLPAPEASLSTRSCSGQGGRPTRVDGWHKRPLCPLCSGPRGEGSPLLRGLPRAGDGQRVPGCDHRERPLGSSVCLHLCSVLKSSGRVWRLSASQEPWLHLCLHPSCRRGDIQQQLPLGFLWQNIHPCQRTARWHVVSTTVSRDPTLSISTQSSHHQHQGHPSSH